MLIISSTMTTSSAVTSSSSAVSLKRMIGLGGLDGDAATTLVVEHDFGDADEDKDIFAIAEIKGDSRKLLTFLALFVTAVCRNLLELLLQLRGDFLSLIGDFTVKKPPSKVLSSAGSK